MSIHGNVRPSFATGSCALAALTDISGTKNGAVLLLGRPTPHLKSVRKTGIICSYYLRLSSDSTSCCGVIIGYDIVVVGNYKKSPITVDTIPDTNFTFTTRVDPVSAPPGFAINAFMHFLRKLVEPPGTAPGSTTLIP